MAMLANKASKIYFEPDNLWSNQKYRKRDGRWEHEPSPIDMGNGAEWWLGDESQIKVTGLVPGLAYGFLASRIWEGNQALDDFVRPQGTKRTR